MSTDETEEVSLRCPVCKHAWTTVVSKVQRQCPQCAEPREKAKA